MRVKYFQQPTTVVFEPANASVPVLRRNLIGERRYVDVILEIDSDGVSHLAVVKESVGTRRANPISVVKSHSTVLSSPIEIADRVLAIRQVVALFKQ